jgi:hypothetical protein
MARNRSAIARGSFDKILDGEGRVDRTVKKKIDRSRELAIINPEDIDRVAGGTLRDKPLSERQRKFVEGVVDKGMSKKEAAIYAGYGHAQSSAMHSEKSEKVQEAIASRRESYEQAAKISRRRVMEGFLEAIDMAKMKADPLSMVAGWREIAKVCGYYEPIKHTVQVSVTGQVLMHQLQALPDEELLKLADESEIIDGEIVLPGQETE